MDTIKESALEVMGEELLATLGTQTHISLVPGFSVGCSTHLVIPTLFVVSQMLFVQGL